MNLMHSSPVLSEIEKYVTNLLNIKELQKRPFHNFNHTLHVVHKCDELATYYKVSIADREVLLTAAWFHDTGYLLGNMNHEEESTHIASEFLNRTNANPKFIERVHALILATKLPAKPNTLLQEILCDADLHHLASKDYLQWSNRLRQEVQLLTGNSIDEIAWLKENISFFKSHRYFTEYAIAFWENQKQLNLQDMIEWSVKST